jgi:GNAT superfamily N-acetyltransferase
MLLIANLFYRSFLNGVNLLRKGQFTVFLQEFIKRLWSESVSFGLCRDLKDNFQNPDAGINITVRPCTEGDFELLSQNSDVSRSSFKPIQDRRNLLRANLPTCYVAVTDDNIPCYMQWLIGSRDNEKKQEIFGDIFPILDKEEALLEGAYTNPSFRGQGIMPAAMSRIAEKAGELGAHRVITFVHVENIPSLKGCSRSGFSPYILRRDRWFIFRRSIAFEKIPEEILAGYHLSTGSRGAEVKEPELKLKMASDTEGAG